MAGDADFDKVSLLLHGDGVNGSTVFTDSSATPKTVTSTGGIAISTAQSKFGGSSGYTPGTAGVYLDISTPNIFDFAEGDFTIESWVNTSAVANDGYLWTSGAYGTSYGMCGAVQSDGTNVLISLLRLDPYAGTACSYAAATSLLAGTWHHVAWVRASGVAYIYVDGVQVASAAFADNLSPAVRFRVGAMNHYYGLDNFSYNYSYSGWFDEFRVTKGVARYTGNFTPATEPFGGATTLALSGLVKDAANAPAARLVRALREDTGALVGHITSDAGTGAYSIDTPHTGGHTLIAYPAAGESLPALTLRGVVPV